MVRLFTLLFSVLFLPMLLLLSLSLLVSCSSSGRSPSPPPEQYVQHTVRWPGETLGLISSWYTGSSGNWPAISSANPTLQITRMQIGDTIQIPMGLAQRTEPMPEDFVTKQTVATKESPKPPEVIVETPPVQSSPENTAPENNDLNAKLWQAVTFSDLSQVKELLQAGADPNYKETNRPMLSWAAQNGSVEIVEALLAAKADVNAKDGVGHTALIRAADTNQPEVIAALVKGQADLNAKAPDGDTALKLAVKFGSVPSVRALIAAGADVNATDSNGNTPALEAALNGNIELIAILGEAKADFSISNLVYTPLSYAVNQGNKELVEALLKAGASPDAKPQTGSPPLHAALDYPEIFTLLLQAKADPNITNSSGDTVLMAAVERDASSQIEELIKAGANPNAKTSNGSSALTLAQNMMKTEMVELLKKNGATE